MGLKRKASEITPDPTTSKRPIDPKGIILPKGPNQPTKNVNQTTKSKKRPGQVR
ncbi:hypothetical protein [Aquimarina sp. RZ0]|uniref:hypothetical protein n=1 Tax=Aquimarina sp. RZ0 TaxID=2607730 RepID=UPI00165ED05D|nr:hypothetical protein [Aquimarina sp. RZ0]